MKRNFLILIILVVYIVVFARVCRAQPGIELGDEKGYLLIIGGGGRPDYMMKRFTGLAALHNTGKIIVIPNASATPVRTGRSHAGQIAELCDNEVTFYNVTPENVNEDSTLKFFEGTGGVFFSGGVQSRLTRLLTGTRLLERIREIYREGGILSGSSAGAAIMSEIMITGGKKRHADENPDSRHVYPYIEGDYIETTEGFGFMPSTIIDQHFVKRERLSRLISLVIENPNHIGIGIDEATAILRKPDNTFEVLGRNSVLIFDATAADITPFDPAKSYLLAAGGMKFHILIEGQKFDLKTLQVIK